MSLCFSPAMNIADCIKCKGRLCGNGKFCPVIHKMRMQHKINMTAKQDFFGEAPNIFVGRFGYPNVNVGLLGTEQYDHHDDPFCWYENNFPIERIIGLRTSLINSNFKAHVKHTADKLLDVSREVSLAEKPVDVEIHLSKRPFLAININQDAMPHGPSVPLKSITLTENPKIPTRVEKIVSDTDLKAAEALRALARRNIDEHYLTRIFSAGNLGVKQERKLVPTRWSITAVDDTLSKQIIEEIQDNKTTAHQAYYGSYLGNHYLILIFPGPWSYELFETIIGEEMSFATDYENYNGRTSYAANTAGGYYAARLAILEHLRKQHGAGSVLALRFITREYWAPLGVWVVRQAARTAMKAKPLEFESQELMLTYAAAFVKKKFGVNLTALLKESKLVDNIRKQKRLNSFLA
ncbi:hypothetical protein HZB03_02985 [Candidatus Woesearchaeota archaeon]|nr:hypothetical protein [Candidatus Woesearchaeota archaeon]